MLKIKKRSVLVTMSSKDYLLQARQLFSSAYFNGGWKGDFVLIAYDIPEEKLSWFRSKNIIIKHIYPHDHISGQWFPLVYLSVFHLFTPFFKKWENVVFIEGDIIVQTKIGWLATLSGLYAVPEFNNYKLKDQFLSREELFYKTNRKTLRTTNTINTSSAVKKLKKLEKEYDLELPSFNAGVLAFSTDIISVSSKEELYRLSQEYAEVSAFGMQGVLNLYFYKSWKKLPIIYNYCFNLAGLGNSKKVSPHFIPILHFAGCEEGHKPWNNSKSIYFKEWNKNLVLSEKINLIKNRDKIDLPKSASYVIGWMYETLIKIHRYKNEISGLKKYTHKYFSRLVEIRRNSSLFIAKKVVNLTILIQLLTCERSKKFNQSFLNTNVYYIVGSKDIFITIFSILSLNYFIPGLKYNIYLNKTPNFFEKYLFEVLLSKKVYIRLLSHQKVADKIIPQLMGFEYAKSFFNFGWSGKKFFIPLYLTKNGRSILIDSDTLFLKRPQEILRWLSEPEEKFFYLSDYSSFSTISFIEADYILKRQHKIENLNSGLLLFPLSVFHKYVSIADIDQYIKVSILLNKQRKYIDYHAHIEMSHVFPIIEQTLHTLIADRIPSHRLNTDYQVFPEHKLEGKKVEDATFMHFTGDVQRFQIYRYFLFVLIRKISALLTKKQTNNEPWFISSNRICVNCTHPDQMKEYA